jgi:prephenate dehydrogenase
MKIAIIGFGRFGQFWAKTLKPFGEVIVFDKSDMSTEAKRIGVRLETFDNLSQLSRVQLVFIAVSIRATEMVIKQIAPFIGKKTIVADVCSVKVLPCKWLQKHLANSQTVGTHPMFGPDSAKSGLRGKQVVICSLNISKANLSKIKKIFEAMELSVIEVSPEKHDRESAFSLAMVHFLGRGLDQLELDKIQIKTKGFERLLELKGNVTHDSWQLFEDMQKFNPYAKEARKALTKALSRLDKQIG